MTTWNLMKTIPFDFGVRSLDLDKTSMFNVVVKFRWSNKNCNQSSSSFQVYRANRFPERRLVPRYHRCTNKYARAHTHKHDDIYLSFRTRWDDNQLFKLNWEHSCSLYSCWSPHHENRSYYTSLWVLVIVGGWAQGFNSYSQCVKRWWLPSFE